MSARRLMAAMALTCLTIGPAEAADVDSSAFEAWRLEDALDLAEDEAAFVPGPSREDGGDAPTVLRGDLVVADDGARRLRAVLVRPRMRGELLLAREAGETRAVDDAYAVLRYDAAPWLRLGLGWFEPRAGAGLVLGPRRTGAVAPAFAPPAPSHGPGAGSPSRSSAVGFAWPRWPRRPRARRGPAERRGGRSSACAIAVPTRKSAEAGSPSGCSRSPSRA